MAFENGVMFQYFHWYAPGDGSLWDEAAARAGELAASGITGVARTTGAAVSPLFAGLLFAQPSLIDVPFYVAGVLKIAYDLLLFSAFRAVKPPEEAGG